MSFITNATTCRHYVRVKYDGSSDFLSELRDPEQFLADPELEEGAIVTLVFDVDTNALAARRLPGRRGRSTPKDEHDATLYFAEDHAASLPELQRWLDVEGLEGE